MPLPTPTAGETRPDFMARCLKDQATREMQGTDEQRVAACERQFEAKGGEDSEIEAKSLAPPTLADQGQVEAIVATLDTVDRDYDVIPRDAFPSGAKVKMSSYDHSSINALRYGSGFPDQPPVGKGAIFIEGDKAIFRGQYNMETIAGREAFLTAKAMGADQEWSFGYRKLQVDRPSNELAAKGAKRVLSKLGPLEVSPVLLAGGVGTRTVALKSASDEAKETVPLIETEVKAKTASVDGTEHPMEDFAYHPNPDEPSTWKFPIFDASHVRNALARFSQADLPSADKAAVLARIHEAATKFNIDVTGEQKAAAATEDMGHKMARVGALLGRR